MRTSSRVVAWSVALTGVLFVTVSVCATVGPVPLSTVAVAKALLNELPFLSLPVSETTRRIVTGIRLPRILLAAAVGFALATAGTVMQGFFRNPMADPSLVGVSSGAAVGAVTAIALPGLIPFPRLRVPAFVGGVLAAFAVYLIASEGGRTPVATLLLAGVAVQTFLGAVISFMLLISGESMRRAVYWLMGHLGSSGYDDVAFVAAVCVVTTPLLFVYAQDLNVMLLGEEDAGYLGVEVERTKRVLLVLSSVVTAGAVAVSGIIGFVGLVVPHVMRLLVGPDHRILMPVSALAGASFLVATDTVARHAAFEIPVGIVTAALGAPFFLYLLRQREVTAL